jgi:hypothetical protein
MTFSGEEPTNFRPPTIKCTAPARPMIFRHRRQGDVHASQPFQFAKAAPGVLIVRILWDGAVVRDWRFIFIAA